MPSDSTHRRILNAAERLFAEHGYAGTSMRQIVAHAAVHLAAVNYHFGSKKRLFAAVLARRLQPIDQERLDRLDDLEAAAGDHPVELEALIEAFVEPTHRALEHDSAGRAAWPKFVARSRLEPGDHWDAAGDGHRRMLSRYIKAFRRALPHLSKREVIYRVFFMIGVAANSLIDARSPDLLNLGPETIQRDPRGFLRRLVAYCAGGMRAPIPSKSTHRRTRRSRKASTRSGS